MVSEKMRVAERLAEAHFSVEPELEHVFVLEPLGSDDDAEPVKLLEVVKGSLFPDIFPVGFAPNPAAGVPYTSLVVEVAPARWQMLREQGFVPFHGKRWKIGLELHRSVAA